jgi:hypothetical protein
MSRLQGTERAVRTVHVNFGIIKSSFFLSSQYSPGKHGGNPNSDKSEKRWIDDNKPEPHEQILFCEFFRSDERRRPRRDAPAADQDCWNHQAGINRTCPAVLAKEALRRGTLIRNNLFLKGATLIFICLCLSQMCNVSVYTILCEFKKCPV